MTPCAHSEDYISCLEWKPSESEEMTFKLRNYKVILAKIFTIEIVDKPLLNKVNRYNL